MREPDVLHRFLFEHQAIRGELVRLDRTWQTVLERRAYPPAVRAVLGEALAATALLYATIKFQGRLTLQLQGSGTLHLLVVQCSHRGELRALARWQDNPVPGPLYRLCAEGVLTVTLEPDQSHDRYQGIVPVTGADIASALEQYFAQSEQLPTRLQLCSNERTAAGLLLQRLPGATIDSDDWRRIQQLGATLAEPELLTLEPRQLLGRLFHEDTLRLFQPRRLTFACTCSRTRTAAMLQSLGQREVEAIIAEQGRVAVRCEFCGADYVFDRIDAGQLFTAAEAVPGSTQLH